MSLGRGLNLTVTSPLTVVTSAEVRDQGTCSKTEENFTLRPSQVLASLRLSLFSPPKKLHSATVATTVVNSLALANSLAEASRIRNGQVDAIMDSYPGGIRPLVIPLKFRGFRMPKAPMTVRAPVRTTLPDDLSRAVHLLSAAVGLSTAEFVRASVRAAVEELIAREPDLARFLESDRAARRQGAERREPVPA